MPKLVTAAKKFWRGEEEIHRAFWLWGVAGNAVCVGIPLVLIAFVVSAMLMLDKLHIAARFDDGWLMAGIVQVGAITSIVYLTWSLISFLRTACRLGGGAAAFSYTVAAFLCACTGYFMLVSILLLVFRN